MKTYNLQGYALEKINEGTFSYIWRVAFGRVAKVKKRPDDASPRELLQELRAQRALFKGGISVPKPFKVSLLRLDELVPALIMKEIQGESMNKMPDAGETYTPEMARAIELRSAELEKAGRLGWVNKDICNFNAIYNPREDKITLVDFRFWIKIGDRKHETR